MTRDVEAAVKAAKGGQAQFRAGKNGVLHMGVGKVRREVVACLFAPSTRLSLSLSLSLSLCFSLLFLVLS